MCSLFLAESAITVLLARGSVVVGVIMAGGGGTHAQTIANCDGGDSLSEREQLTIASLPHY